MTFLVRTFLFRTFLVGTFLVAPEIIPESHCVLKGWSSFGDFGGWRFGKFMIRRLDKIVPTVGHL